MSELDYPSDLRYTATTSGSSVGDDGVVRIGITSFAQDALGDVVYVSLPAVGDTVTPGDSAARSSRRSRSATSTRPSSGEVTATNAALDGAPELINSDPYGEGWMFELRPGRRRRPSSGLMDAPTYTRVDCPERAARRPDPRAPDARPVTTVPGSSQRWMHSNPPGTTEEDRHVERPQPAPRAT